MPLGWGHGGFPHLCHQEIANEIDLEELPKLLRADVINFLLRWIWGRDKGVALERTKSGDFSPFSRVHPTSQDHQSPPQKHATHPEAAPHCSRSDIKPASLQLLGVFSHYFTCYASMYMDWDATLNAGEILAAFHQPNQTLSPTVTLWTLSLPPNYSMPSWPSLCPAGTTHGPPGPFHAP